MTKFSINLKHPISGTFSRFWRQKTFLKKSGSAPHNFTWVSSTMPKFWKKLMIQYHKIAQTEGQNGRSIHSPDASNDAIVSALFATQWIEWISLATWKIMWTWSILIFSCLVFTEDLFINFRAWSTNIVFKIFGNCNPQTNFADVLWVNENKCQNILPTPILKSLTHWRNGFKWSSFYWASWSICVCVYIHWQKKLLKLLQKICRSKIRVFNKRNRYT